MMTAEKHPHVNRGVEENLRFLMLEVRKQVAATRRFLADPVGQPADRALAKDDYIDNLRTFIRRKCFAAATQESETDGPAVKFLMAVEIVTTNLERIADFCTEAVGQTRFIQEEGLLENNDFLEFFDLVEEGLETLERAVFDRDAHLAVEICRKEQALDALYEKKLRSLAAEDGHDTLSVLTVIFIYHYLERMGDALLNIGEAILSASLGESVKFEQYRSLEQSLESSRDHQPIAGVTLETVAETRSGCRIGRVRQLPVSEAPSTNGKSGRKAGASKGHSSEDRSDESSSRRNGSKSSSTADKRKMPEVTDELVIFKEGQLQKLINERRGAERWQEVMPGLPPKILSFHESKDSAAILFEYLSGRTFEDLVLRGTNRHLTMALGSLLGTLDKLWKRTYLAEPVAPRFLKQLVDRLDDVYALHPGLRKNHQALGNINVPPFEHLVQSALMLDEVLVAPFSVFIHGDFNLDNIIHGGKDDSVHFIDLHRSRMMDYVQDVTVLLVSIMRLRVFEMPVRQRMHEAVSRIYGFSREFADVHGDELFSARVAMGMVRSLATSARFVLDAEFASDLFLRARYLLEQLLEHDKSALAEFELQLEVLLD